MSITCNTDTNPGRPTPTPPSATTPSDPEKEECPPVRCGPNTNTDIRKKSGGRICPVCTCARGHSGDPESPAGCEPNGSGSGQGQSRGCYSNRQCGPKTACRRGRCVSPCDGRQVAKCRSQGEGGACVVENHRPKCACRVGFEPAPTGQGDCTPIPSKPCPPCILPSLRLG